MGSSSTNYLVASFLLLAAAGCYQKTVTRHRMEGTATRSWIGESIDSVFSVWGPLNAAESDGSGGKVYVYRKSAEARISTDAPGVPGSTDINRMSENAARDDKRDGNLTEDARFWTDSAGKVYRYWFSDEVWKSRAEKTIPPAQVTPVTAKP